MFLFYFNFKNAIRFSIFLPLFGNVSWKSRCVRQEFGEENLYSQIELLTVWSIETKLKINFLISSYTVEQRQIFQRLESSLRRVGTKDFWLEFKTKYKFNKYVSNTPGYNKLTIRSSCGGQLSVRYYWHLLYIDYANKPKPCNLTSDLEVTRQLGLKIEAPIIQEQCFSMLNLCSECQCHGTDLFGLVCWLAEHAVM